MRTTLDRLKINDIGKVVDIKGNAILKRKLLAMGITRGAQIKVVRVAPLKDPIEIELKGYKLSLRRNEAENILVEIKEVN